MPVLSRHISRRNFLQTAILATAADMTKRGATFSPETINLQQLVAAARPGDVVSIPAGHYFGDVWVETDGITLKGSGRGYYFDGAVNSGTVIHGRIFLNSCRGVTVEDLAVVVGAGDGIVSGAMGAMAGLQQNFRRLLLVGGGWQLRQHGILCQAGGGIVVEDVQLFNFYHGLALRCGDAAVSGLRAQDCASSSVIVKAASGSGDVRDVVISNVRIFGTRANLGGAIHIQSWDDGVICERVGVVNAMGCREGGGLVHVWRRAGVCRGVRLANVLNGAGVPYTVDGADDVAGDWEGLA